MEQFLPRDPQSVRDARRAVTAELEAAAVDPEIVEVAELLAGELVTNALQHGQGTLMLCIKHGNRRLRVEVADDGPALTMLDGHHDTTGYGLKMLEALAARYGAQSTRGDGKKVWFELNIDPRT